MKSPNTPLLIAFLAAASVGSAHAQVWNPKPGWKDSYAVGGKCYCDSNGYDHNLDQKTAPTPVGTKNVVEICETIAAKLGTGPTAGRIPYNDIQCGNGPANDAPDEAGCPGRVDIGPAGCNQIGPKWDLASVYGTSPPGAELNRSGWTAGSSRNAAEAALAIDGNPSTRWATRQTQRNGQVFAIDTGKVSAFNRIVLESTGNPFDYPRSYEVQVSDNGVNWSAPVASGVGSMPVTDISFPSQAARHVRIVQRGSDAARWWSIHEVNLYNVTGGSGAGPILDSSQWTLKSSSHQGDVGNAVDADAQTRWATGTPQRPGQSFQIDMQAPRRFNRIVLASEGNPYDYPRGYRVVVSDDGVNWSGPIATGAGTSAITDIAFAARTARFIRIEQTGTDINRWWSIHELFVEKAAD